MTRRLAYADTILSRVSTSSFLIFGILVRIAESNHLHTVVTSLSLGIFFTYTNDLQTSKWPGRPNLDAPSIIALLLDVLLTSSLCPKVLGIRASTGGDTAECQVVT